MKWSVRQLLANREQGLRIDTSLDVSDITEIDKEIRQIAPVKVVGNGHVTTKAITFHLTIEGEMILPCARTLNDVKYPFSIEATEIFKLKDDGTFDEEDEDVHELKGQIVDLIPYVKERILLEKPLRVISDEVEETLAPQSGTDWKFVIEDEQKDSIDPRLKKLEKFFEKEN